MRGHGVVFHEPCHQRQDHGVGIAAGFDPCRQREVLEPVAQLRDDLAAPPGVKCGRHGVEPGQPNRRVQVKGIVRVFRTGGIAHLRPGLGGAFEQALALRQIVCLGRGVPRHLEGKEQRRFRVDTRQVPRFVNRGDCRPQLADGVQRSLDPLWTSGLLHDEVGDRPAMKLVKRSLDLISLPGKIQVRPAGHSRQQRLHRGHQAWSVHARLRRLAPAIACWNDNSLGLAGFPQGEDIDQRKGQALSVANVQRRLSEQRGEGGSMRLQPRHIPFNERLALSGEAALRQPVEPCQVALRIERAAHEPLEPGLERRGLAQGLPARLDR